MYRLNEKSVIRAGYGRTINPLPWSRPMRGSYPYDIYLSQTAEHVRLGHHPRRRASRRFTLPDLSTGRVPLPVGVFIAHRPSRTTSTAATIQQWNVAFEQRLPWDISAEIAYVGTATDGGYADLNINYGVPGGGNAARKYFARRRHDRDQHWGSRTKSRYKGLQLALNRPFRNGLMLKGAYTLVRGEEHGGRGRVGRPHLEPPDEVRRQLRARRLRPDAHRPARASSTSCRSSRTRKSAPAARSWAAGRSTASASWYSGTPYSIGGTNNALNCQGCGSVFINYSGDKPEPIGSVGLGTTETYYDKSLFSQPTGLDVNGFGTSKRNQFRRPNVWNVDMSLFKAFQVGRFRPEIRIEVANVFNHPNWGAPVTTFTANNFLQFTPGQRRQRQRHRDRRDQHARTAAHPDRPASAVLGVS